MENKYFLFINDYEVILRDPIEIITKYPLNLGDIIDFGEDEIRERLDFEYDTFSFR